ncbi:MAG: phage tail protein [Rhizobiaceae bacterium]|nr:phage tail protein [Rhizobiaceae bacterium]
MVKTPKTRHSKPQKEPVTIELEAGAVSRVEEPATPAEESAAVSAAEPEGSAEPMAADASSASGGSDPIGEQASDRTLGSEWTPEPADQTARDDDDLYRPGSETTPPADDAPAERAAATTAQASSPDGAGPSRRGGGSLLAGLAGGAIALAAVAAAQVAGFWPGDTPVPGDTSGVAALQADVEALKQDVAALRSAPGVDVSALEQAVADSVGRTDTLASGLDALRGDIEALKSAIQSGGAGDGPALEALAARIAQVETAVAALGQGSGGASSAELTALGDRIAGVEAALQSARDAAVVDSGRLAAVEESLSDVRSRVDALGTRVETLGDQPRVALALTAAALKAALDRGGPFLSEVETFAAVAPDAPEIAELRRIAAEGVATRTALAALMEESAGAMIAAGQVVDENAGFFARLWASAQSLVTVRPIGPVDGEGVPETVARMEQAVKDGNLAGAMAEYEKLPEPVRLAGAELAETVKGRLAAEQLIDKALADALKAA